MGVFLEGIRVLLRTVERADLPQLAKLISDRNIGELTGEVHPMTEKEMDEFYDRCQRTEVLEKHWIPRRRQTGGWLFLSREVL